MGNRLDGRVAIVTGAARGIGRGVARINPTTRSVSCMAAMPSPVTANTRVGRPPRASVAGPSCERR